MREKFCIVMPIVKYSYVLGENSKKQQTHEAHYNNYERFTRIGLQTLLKYLVWDDVARFIVITPKTEMEDFREKLHIALTSVGRLSLFGKFHIVAEEEIVSDVVRDIVSGGDPLLVKTRTQMLVKLLVANRYVTTQQYLILDDDVVLLRSFGYNDLFANKERTHLKFTPDMVYHDRWWKGSCDVLQLDYGVASKRLHDMQKKRWVINVTPEVISTKYVRKLIKHLEGMYGSFVPQLLLTMDGRWTEYTLYWLYLMQLGVVKDVYKGSYLRISDGTKSVWYASDDLAQKLREMYNNRGKQYFGVIQSNVPEHHVEHVEIAMKEIGMIE